VIATVGVEAAGAPVIDERRPARLERQLELDQQAADARDRPEDGGDLLRTLGQRQEGLDVAEDQGRAPSPEQLAHQFLLRLGDLGLGQPVIDVAAVDEDGVTLILVRGRLREFGVEGRPGGFGHRDKVLDLRQHDHVVAAGDHLGRTQQTVDERGGEPCLLHGRPDAFLGGLLEGPTGHRGRLRDDGEDVLRRLEIHGPHLQVAPWARLGDPDGFGGEKAGRAEAQDCDQTKDG
jgi:hypothetical protein